MERNSPFSPNNFMESPIHENLVVPSILLFKFIFSPYVYFLLCVNHCVIIRVSKRENLH